MRRPLRVIAEALQLRGAADEGRIEIRQMLSSPANKAAEGGQAGQAGIEFQLAERVVEYLEARAAKAPVVLVAEDLHWADPASLMTFGRLAHEGAQLPLLLIGTLSPYPAPTGGCGAGRNHRQRGPRAERPLLVLLHLGHPSDTMPISLFPRWPGFA